MIIIIIANNARYPYFSPKASLSPNESDIDFKKSIKLNTIVYISFNPGDISERVDVTPTLNNNMILLLI